MDEKQIYYDRTTDEFRHFPQDPEELDPRPDGYSISHFIAYAFLVGWFALWMLIFWLIFKDWLNAGIYTVGNITGFLITRWYLKRRKR